MHCNILNIYAEDLMALENKIFKVFPGAKYYWDMANLDPMGMVFMIYVGDHNALQHTKYIS